MSGNVSLGDLPSWILVILIGFGIEFASSNGILTEYGGLGELFIFGGIALGVFYFATDISNKI
ncbi:hypothetical protein [Haloferax sp. YSSS75]|uniref:hypothetical protein n=1 Tax=Haloferax sp. YSSS75 TaxID=3388564 RepID=UPI00398C8C72